MEKCRTRRKSDDELYERHHIIPKCIGGNDDKENLVYMTPEEHYVAHQLLVKIYHNPSLVYALNMMTVYSKFSKRTNNKKYGWVRRRFINECKKRTGKLNSSYGRCWYHDPITLRCSKFKEEDVPTGWVRGRVPKKNTQKVLVTCSNPSCNNDFHKTFKSKKRFCSRTCQYQGRYQENKNTTVKILNGREKEFIDLYEKNGSINKSLKSMGFTGSGGYYHWAKNVIECSTNGSS